MEGSDGVWGGEVCCSLVWVGGVSCDVECTVVKCNVWRCDVVRCAVMYHAVTRSAMLCSVA